MESKTDIPGHATSLDAMASGRAVTLYLDFDGTLVELAETPDAIVVPSRLHDLLARLHEALEGRLFLVSGRKIDDLEAFLPRFRGDLAGSHGGEYRIGGEITRHPATNGERFARILKTAREFSASSGILLEEKPAGLVLHWRTQPERAREAQDFAKDLLSDSEGFALHAARDAIEIKPSDVSKAAAVRRLAPEHDSNPDHCPIAIGDDATDEDMFAEVMRKGGFGVRVGSGETKASVRLPGVRAVHDLLEGHLINLEKAR